MPTAFSLAVTLSSPNLTFFHSQNGSSPSSSSAVDPPFLVTHWEGLYLLAMIGMELFVSVVCPLYLEHILPFLPLLIVRCWVFIVF